jgi:acetolactate synthase-1/2/3 large subunit
VLAITGDGSLQQNIQELQTYLQYKLPIKLFIWNNDGYLSIRFSQKNYFEERYIGESSRSGVSIPDTLKIAQAYGIPASRVKDLDLLDQEIQKALDHEGPYILEIIVPRDQLIIPTVSSRVNEDGSMSSRPLEDMAPFLARAEYLKNMIVPPL